MPRTASGDFLVSRPEEWAAFGSVAAVLALQALEHLGTGTVGAIAEVAGLKPTALYHHLDRFERIGLIRRAGTARAKVGRAGVVYEFFASRIRLDYEASTRRNLAEAKRLFRTLLRAAERQLMQALESGDASEATRTIDWVVFMDAARLEEGAARRIVDAAKSAHRLIAKRKGDATGRRWTLFVAGFPSTGAPSSRTTTGDAPRRRRRSRGE